MQWAAYKLLYAGNGPARSRRDAAILGQCIQSVWALTNRDGGMEVERLLSATAEADGKSRRLTAFADACRRDIPMPTPIEAQWAGLGCHPELAVNALTTVAQPRPPRPWAGLHESETATVSPAFGSLAGVSGGPVAVPLD